MISPGTIEIKNTAVLTTLLNHKAHPKLDEIINWVAEHYGLVITEFYRKPRHPGDVHSTNPVRAIDLRYWCYPDHVAEEIRDAINTRWQYDPARPGKQCAIIHNVGLGMHFHIQIHDNTCNRKN